jgi:hypothetical protein
MEIRLLETAKDDLREGWKFYEQNAAGLKFLARTRLPRSVG